MGRKNGNVRRSNDRGRRARQAAADLPKRPAPQWSPPVETLVLPDGQCTDHGPHRKAWFATEEKAAKALRQAQKKRASQGSGHVEKRYYPCPTKGSGFHLTSRETFDEGISKFRHQQYLDQTKNRRREEIRREQ